MVSGFSKLSSHELPYKVVISRGLSAIPTKPHETNLACGGGGWRSSHKHPSRIPKWRTQRPLLEFTNKGLWPSHDLHIFICVYIYYDMYTYTLYAFGSMYVFLGLNSWQDLCSMLEPGSWIQGPGYKCI